MTYTQHSNFTYFLDTIISSYKGNQTVLDEMAWILDDGMIEDTYDTVYLFVSIILIHITKKLFLKSWLLLGT